MGTNLQGIEDLPEEDEKGVDGCSPPDFEAGYRSQISKIDHFSPVHLFK